MSRIMNRLGIGSRGVLFALAFLIAGLSSPPWGYAASSGSGVWDLTIFGNYDLTAPNTGTTFTNLPSGDSSPTWNKMLDNGYGVGVGVAYWFTDVVAFRIEAQTSLFTVPSSVSAFNGFDHSMGALQSSPITGGIEVKLLGDPEYYLYAVADAGVAYEASMNGQNFFGSVSANSWTVYGDAGLGLNLSWVFVEAKIACLPQSLPGAGGSFGAGQNAFWYVPVTAGVNF